MFSVFIIENIISYSEEIWCFVNALVKCHLKFASLLIWLPYLIIWKPHLLRIILFRIIFFLTNKPKL